MLKRARACAGQGDAGVFYTIEASVDSASWYLQRACVSDAAHFWWVFDQQKFKTMQTGARAYCW